MSSADDALASVLAADRTTAQRLTLLRTFRNELFGEKAIQALLAAAREEKSLDLRRAFLEHAASCDITRIVDRATFINGVLYFAAIEEEVSLRKQVLGRLAAWSSHDPAIEDILLETLIYELELDTQTICVEGLSQCVLQRPENKRRLLEFVPKAPQALRQSIVEMLVKFDVQMAQAALTVLLHPAESDELREFALEELAGLPQLEPATLKALETFIVDEPDEEMQTSAVRILRDSKQVNAELFEIIFALFARFPGHADLLEAVWHRLASFPELLPKLIELFQTIRSAQVRARVLETLKEVEALPLFIKALCDPSPHVRAAAVKCCRHHQPNNAGTVEREVVEAARTESVVVVRETMASLFTSARRRKPEVDRALVEWLSRETEPRVARVLARTLAAIPLSSENGPVILRAYRKFLNDPATEESLRGAILARLADAAFQNQPELAECVRALIQRADTLGEVQMLYARLRGLEPDARMHADLILTLFFRFAGEYPREPLDGWVKDFQSLAPSNPLIRSQIPYIIKLTGASWLSGSAEATAQKSVFLPALLEQVRRGNWVEAGRLLRESWEQRTIRKSDMLTLFKKLLRTPGEESLMQSCVVMMAKGGMTTPEILDLGFGYLQDEPRNGTYTYLIAEFLQGNDQDHTPMRSIDEVRVDLSIARKQDPHYRARVFEHFTQSELNRYFRQMPEEMVLPPPIRDWSEWEYQLWPDKGLEWKMAEMFFALKPFDRIAALLASPVDPIAPPARSIHYLLLLYLWKNTGDGWPPAIVDDLLRGTGTLLRNTAGKRSHALLHDRAILVFRHYWTRQVNSQTGGRHVSPDLAEMAAEVYAELCEIGSRFECDAAQRFPAKLPEMLQGLDSKRLESIWRFDREAWERLYKEHFEGAEEDAKARELYENAKQAEEEIRYPDAHALYKELLAKYPESRFVKKNRGNIEYSLEDSDPSKPSAPNMEDLAATQYGFLQKEVEKGNVERALHKLGWVVKSYWRTKFIQDKREELLALRKKLMKG